MMAEHERERRRLLAYVSIDVVMIVLLIANLVLIIFDWLYGYDAIQRLLLQVLPGFARWYAEQVQPRFILIDLGFVAVFLLHFFVGWIVAAVRRDYHRWYFYPFVHWYDILGCIPIAGFRFLRLLRVITIVYRLHRAGFIDLAETGPARLLTKYYGVLVEEVSDRVVIKMLSDVQQEVRSGGPLLDRIVADVIRPRKAELVEWMSRRIQAVASRNYERYRGELDGYVSERIDKALDGNRELAALNLLPVVGPAVRNTVERAIIDIVSNVIHGIVQDLSSKRNKRLMEESADVLFDALLLKEEDPELNAMVIGTIDQSLEIVKHQVSIQQWKVRDLAEDEEDLKRRLRARLDDLVRR